jgi:hypothetical protein
MTLQDSEVHPMQDPEGQLELALIEEFLLSHGHVPRDVPALPEDQRRHLLEAASVYAAGRLAEIQARAHYVHEIHRQE